MMPLLGFFEMEEACTRRCLEICVANNLPLLVQVLHLA